MQNLFVVLLRLIRDILFTEFRSVQNFVRRFTENYRLCRTIPERQLKIMTVFGRDRLRQPTYPIPNIFSRVDFAIKQANDNDLLPFLMQRN